MAKKDIAFLFYPNDWLGGTQGFTFEQKGAYMELILFQFNNGRMSIDDVKDVLGLYFDKMWERKLKAKFTEEQGLYFNKKIEEVKSKRTNYSKSRKENFGGGKTKTDKPEVKYPVTIDKKPLGTIELYFADLPNSQHFEQICRQLSLTKDDLLTWIAPFKTKAELEYLNFSRFLSHFKNYVAQELKKQNNDTGNSKSKSGAYNADSLSTLNNAIKGLPKK